MKRKGRKHLPKAGTKPDEEHVFHESQQDVINFGLHRRGRGAGATVVWVSLIVLAAFVLIGVMILS